MKGINPLLYGLNDFYGSSGSSGLLQSLGQTSGSAVSFIGSGNIGMNISSQAKGLSELSTLLKADRGKTTLSGFNQTVKNLLHDTDTTSLQGFINFGLAAAVNRKKEIFTKMMNGVNALNGKDNSALGISIVKQAVKTYESKGLTLAGKFVDTATSLMDRKYANAKDMTSLVGKFTTTWNAVLTQTKTSKDIPDLNTFAKKAVSLDNDGLKVYLEQINTAIKKAGSS